MSDEHVEYPPLWRGNVPYEDSAGTQRESHVLVNGLFVYARNDQGELEVASRDKACETAAHLARQLRDLRAAALDYLNNDGSRGRYDAHEMLKARANLVALLEAP